MSILSLDPQATGWRDDGHEAGVIRAEQVRGGELVRVPLRDYHFSYNGASALTTRGAWQENGDGTASGFLLSVSAGASAPHTIDFIFMGRVLGLRFNPGYNSPNIGPGITDCSAMIDGVSYPVAPYIVRPDTGAVATNVSGEVGFIVTDNLDYGPHYCTLVFPPHPTINARWSLFGYLLEKAAGYEPSPRYSFLGAPTVLGTTATAANLLVSGSGAKAPRAIRGALFINSTATPVTATIATTGTGAADIANVSVPANGSAQWQPPGPLALAPSGLAFRASAASAVTVTLVEEAN